MKENITINFKNITSELKTNNMKLCFLKDGVIFIENEQKDLYQMETYYIGSYLDKLIKDAVTVSFSLVNHLLSQNIEDWKKEIWDFVKVEDFIKSHSLL